jgi:hypothetical protein
MSQRGVTSDMVDFVLTHGRNNGDKIILSRKDLVLLVEGLDGAQRAIALKLLDKGGLVVVEDCGAILTTYNLNSYSRRKRGSARAPARRTRAYR